MTAMNPQGDTLTATVAPFAADAVWCPSPSTEHRLTPYPLPKQLLIGVRDSEESAAKYSPPPLAVIVEAGGRRAMVGVAADAGWHRFNEVTFDATSEGVTVTIDLEGRTDPHDAAAHVRIDVVESEPGESRHDLLRRGLLMQYPDAATQTAPPDWWLRPIYCGWGDQSGFTFVNEGLGPERRSLAYCIQGLYERWIRRLDEHRVPFGTTIIDAGWSPAGVWEVDEQRWPDLKGFIAREHERGRRVLLWIATWMYDQLPIEHCITADGERITADPTHPQYLEDLRRRVTHLLSPDGIDADGFKIDQLRYCPTYKADYYCPRFGWANDLENPRDINMHGDNWGIEMLHAYQKAIYTAAKNAKPDALITSSTVHPYFHDTFDMVRIHDMGSVVPDDLMAAMKARVDLGRAAVPGKPVDTDDWIHSDYDRWLDYTCNSHALGVPCIFYAERFMQQWQQEPATRTIDDLDKVAAAWRAAGFEASS